MIPDDALREIARHARETYPAECCGLLLADASGALRFQPVANIAGSAESAATSSRTRRDGYVMDPKAVLEALDAADRSGGRLWGIVHSHPDVGAYFSSEDRNMALGGGTEPLWPDVRYLVVSVRGGNVDGARLYAWDASGRDFREEQAPSITSFS
jgi:adenylyltransferase/sulfurtransferase